MRPPDDREKYNRFTGAMVDKSLGLLGKYDLGIYSDVRFLADLVEYSWEYEAFTNFAIYPDFFNGDEERAKEGKVDWDKKEDYTIGVLHQKYLQRHGETPKPT